MRWITVILLLLTVSFWVGSQIDVAQSYDATPAPPPRWVRTVDGWEKTANWVGTRPTHRPTLHPLVVTLTQAMLSLYALATFPPRRPIRQVSRRTSRTTVAARPRRTAQPR